MPRVKLLSMAQCSRLVCQPIYPTLLGVPFVCKNFLCVIFFASFCTFTHSTILFAYASLASLYIFQVHSPYSCCNTHHKTQNHFGATLNVKKLTTIPSSHLFYVGQPIFFKHPIHFMMASLFYIHMETSYYHQWVGWIPIFFIHPYAIVTIFPFILHHLCHVCYSLLQLSCIVIRFFS